MEVVPLSHWTLGKEQDRDIYNHHPEKAERVKIPRLGGEGSVWDSCGVLSDPITETPWYRPTESDNDGNQ